MATTYLVDYENVHEPGLNGILDLPEGDTVCIIFTEYASRINMDCLCGYRVPLSFIKVEGGDQSLDMHLVSLLGFMIGHENTPDESYVIVSRDAHYVNVASYWCDFFADSKKVSVLPDIRGSSPEQLRDNMYVYHDIVAERIKTLIKNQGVYGEYGRMMLVSTLCGNMNEFPAYVKERERLGVKGRKLLSTFDDVIDIRLINCTDWAVLKDHPLRLESEPPVKTAEPLPLSAQEEEEPEMEGLEIPDIVAEGDTDGETGPDDEANAAPERQDTAGCPDRTESEPPAPEKPLAEDPPRGEPAPPEGENQEPGHAETVAEYTVRCRQIFMEAALKKEYPQELAEELALTAFPDPSRLYRRINIYHAFLRKYGRLRGNEYYRPVKWMRFPVYTGDVPAAPAGDIAAPAEASSETPPCGTETETHPGEAVSVPPAGDIAVPAEAPAETLPHSPEEEASPCVEPCDELPCSVYDCPLENMGLPLRVYSALETAGYRCARQIICLPDAELLRIKNLGRKSVAAIRDWVSAHMKDISDA